MVEGSVTQTPGAKHDSISNSYSAKARVSDPIMNLDQEYDNLDEIIEAAPFT